MSLEEKLKEINDMGITICNKTYKFKSFSPNKFAEYISRNSNLIYSKGDFYNYKNGKWTKIEELTVLQRIRNLLHKYYDDIWSTKREKEYIEALKRIIHYDGEFNNNKRYINMLNGMYDLEEFTLVEHNKDFYSTIQIPIIYSEGAECPRFKKFLQQSFQDDEESQKLAQEWAGYLLTAETKAQKALLLYGSGANGKGVFIDLISECIGQDNISSIPLNELHKGFSRVCLHNKLANISSENETNGKSYNTQYFKMITGEDIINAEQKNKPVFSFRNTAKIVVSTNNLPHTKDNSYGYWRRLSILNFCNTVKEEDRDRDLKDKLKTELQGIFLWAIDGLKRLKDNNYKFTESKKSEEVLNQYQKEINPFIMFFEECIITTVDKNYREDNKVIYNSYKSWARANGMEGQAKISVQKFWKKFEEYAKELGIKDCVQKRSGSFRYHTGVKVIGDFRFDDVNNPVFRGYLGG